MSGDAAHVHHAIDYVELAVTDMAAAQQFYVTAFGWEFTDDGPEYAGIRIGGRFSFPGGRRFHFTDPSGNELAVWSAGRESSLP